jgi:hypothetical protein
MFCRLEENRELLKLRHLSVMYSKSNLEADVKDLAVCNRANYANLTALKPELKRLKKLRETYRKYVKLFLCLNRLYLLPRSKESSKFV